MKRITVNWRSPKFWAAFIALNIVCSPTVWVLVVAAVAGSAKAATGQFAVNITVQPRASCTSTGCVVPQSRTAPAPQPISTVTTNGVTTVTF